MSEKGQGHMNWSRVHSFCEFTGLTVNTLYLLGLDLDWDELWEALSIKADDECQSSLLIYIKMIVHEGQNSTNRHVSPSQCYKERVM